MFMAVSANMQLSTACGHAVLPTTVPGQPQPSGPTAAGALLQPCFPCLSFPRGDTVCGTHCYLILKGTAEAGCCPLPGSHISSLALVRGDAETCWWDLELPPLTLFVSGQHPHFDVAQFQQLDGLGDSILQLVLNGCGPKQLEGERADVMTWGRTRCLGTGFSAGFVTVGLTVGLDLKGFFQPELFYDSKMRWWE